MEQQKKLLKNGISFVIMFAQDKPVGKMKLAKLSGSHDRNHLNIQAWICDNWKESLLASVEIYDTQLTPETKNNWHLVLDLAIAKMKESH